MNKKNLPALSFVGAVFTGLYEWVATNDHPLILKSESTSSGVKCPPIYQTIFIDPTYEYGIRNPILFETTRSGLRLTKAPWGIEMQGFLDELNRIGLKSSEILQIDETGVCFLVKNKKVFLLDTFEYSLYNSLVPCSQIKNISELELVV